MINHYRIIEPLGSGGMGEVYLAEDTRLHRRVALKILPPDMAANPERRSRFENEARAIAALSHPNIVTIYSVEEDGDVHFITMEVARGRTLTQIIPPAGTGLGRFLDIAIPLTDAVAAAHQQGIVHRDLKPDNIVLSDEGLLKVLDFGLAKLVETAGGPDSETQLPTASVTAEGRVVGTVAYMSPEQAEGKSVDARSDVFSLGIIFYQVATGELPFTGETPMSTLSSIIKDTPRAVSDLNAGLPRDLARIINRCLSKKPDDRFHSAQGLRSELMSLKRESDSGTVVAAGAGAGRRRAMPLVVLGVVLAAALAIVAWLSSAAWLNDGGGFEPTPPSQGSRGTSPASRSAPAMAPDSAGKIVVLPFQNLGSANDAYFAAGITDEITSRLAGISTLGVISSRSALQYKDSDKTIPEIGRELGVGYVLEGTVQWDPASGQVRVTPKLSRVSDDTQVWSDRYDRRLESIFDVQSEIAGEVVRQLGLTLGASEKIALDARPTQDIEAYQAYLRARGNLESFIFDREKRGETLRLLERAVEIDPGFAHAWSELSKAHSRQYHDGIDVTEARLSHAREAADRALEIDPDLPEARIALGYYYYWGRRDYDRALAEFEKAAGSRPPTAEILEARGYILRRQGEWEESTRLLEAALRLDPRNASSFREIWTNYIYLRDLDTADGICGKLFELGQPEEVRALCLARNAGLRGDLERTLDLLSPYQEPRFPFTVAIQWVVNLNARRYEEALAWVDRWSPALIEFDFPPADVARAAVYLLMGREEEATPILDAAAADLESRIEKEPRDPDLRVHVSNVYAMLGRGREAIREATAAADMVPLSHDALDGPSYLENLAVVYGQVGEADKALDLIDQLLGMPYELSAAGIEIDVRWDPLRDHPRYREILDKHR